MNYYPVGIPTLNRFEHLKRCVDSLRANTDANKTELIIGLDYPPNKKYEEGYCKVLEYVYTIDGFAKVTIFKRDKNVGPVNNWNCILEYIFSNYDAAIMTEDDNEFSPCFLDYINQNLEKYKNDPSVFRICGYLPFDHHFSNEYSQFLADRYIAWGVGMWREKEKTFKKFYQSQGLMTLANDKTVRKYFEKDRIESILVSLVSMAKTGNLLGDVIVAAYMEYKSLRNILPTKSMVRNHGWDGSGLHGGYTYGYKEQEICLNSDYCMKEAPDSFTWAFEKEMHLVRRKKRRDINNIQNCISWYLYKYTSIFCTFKGLRRIAKKIKNRKNGSK